MSADQEEVAANQREETRIKQALITDPRPSALIRGKTPAFPITVPRDLS
jgi:hypothetical protein